MSTTKTKVKKKAAKPTVSVTIAQFDTIEPFEILRDVPIPEYTDISLAEYAPRDTTPLRDATASIINHLDEARAKNPGGVTIGLLLDRSGSMNHLRESVVAGANEFVAGMKTTEVDDEAAGKVLCVVFTDGHENASREVSPTMLQDMIREREQDGWTFIYMGANQDAWSTGQATGFSGSVSGQTANFVPSAGGTRAAFANITSDAVNYLGDQGTYRRMRGGTSQRSILEDGTESLANTGAPSAVPQPVVPPQPPTNSAYDINDALKKARGEDDDKED